MNTTQSHINSTETMAEGESALKILFSLSLDLLCTFGQNGYFQQINPAWEKVLGWTCSQLRSRPWIEWIYREDREFTLNALRDCGHGKLVEYRNRIYHKDGSLRWLAWRISQDEQGLIYGVAKNITSIKELESGLDDGNSTGCYEGSKGSENLNPDDQNLKSYFALLTAWLYRYKAVSQISGQLLYEWNTQTNELIWGHNIEQVLGYYPGEIANTGQGWDQLIYPDDLERYRHIIERVIVTKEPIDLEYRMRKKDGTYITVENKGQFYLDSAGNLNRLVGLIVDITKRKQAEEALRLSEKRFRLAVDNFPGTFMIYDAQRRLQFINQQGVKLTGVSDSPLLGHTDEEIYPRVFKDIYVKLLQKAVETRTPQVEELTLTLPEVGELTVLATYIPLLDEQGNIYQVIGIIQDTTQRKQAEVELRQAYQQLRLNTAAALDEKDAQFRRVFDEAPIGMSLSDLDYQFIQVNRALYEMLGYTKSELMALNGLAITHPEDLEQAQPYIRQVIQGEIDSFKLEIRYRKKNQDTLWGNLTMMAMRDQAGEILCILSMVEDITERKQAEEALRHSEERFRAIIEDQTELICRLKLDGTLTFVNDAYCRYFGKDRSELVGKVFLPKMPPEDEDIVTRNFRSLSVDNPINTYEHRVLLDSGEIRWQQWSDRAMFDEHGNFLECQAVGRDITELKQAEADIRKALVKEKELSQLRSGFVSLVSHEFRTPLTTIQSSAQMLQRYEDKLSPEKKLKHHDKIQHAVLRMTQLLDDVLTIGKADAGKLKFEPASMDLVALCQDILENIKINLGYKHNLIFITHGCCQDALIDERLLSHVVNNLLLNAIKYSPEGGTIKFELNCDSSTAVIQVQDQGIGIPKKDQEKLFESFERASNVGSIPGTGLGLAIVKKCLDLHEGTIAVNSEVGVGTTFTVTLPLHLATDQNRE
ncbi:MULTISPECIES: PAS domain S-box protein [unclassified Moorena]|uniref:PAS domain-containing protein n=1 Tax=unclassified Moorena TaxID=2683338 RepID=UPI0013CB5BCB|nr:MULTISPECIES: PAS domain S-box protein [unclassified Moorena]NEO20513.1 PAS domain S-box protein [Moorena sp. SIO4A5]NEQ56975.1 PAS domain S-box protein [Moorena sp. SIO4A1]